MVHFCLCSVTTVDSGSKALEFLVSPDQHEIEVNLIITDYCMPGMSGYDLLKKIKVQFVFFFSSWDLFEFDDDGSCLLILRVRFLMWVLFEFVVNSGVIISEGYPSCDHVI